MKICNHEINIGEKKQITIIPNNTSYEMPATIIYGAKSNENSKTILITAGIHSGEYPGIKATTKLAEKLNPIDVNGVIILIHCVNTSGFISRNVDVFPEDNANLNANYPGNPSGTIGEKIASYFVTDIFPNINYIVDLHSGGKYEELTPCLFFQTAEKVTEMSEKIAKATNIPYLIKSTATKGHYSYAGQLGIPGVLLERGFGGLCKKEDILAYKEDLIGILTALDFITFDSNSLPNKLNQTIISDAVYLSSEYQGLWYPNIISNQSVKKGELLGVIEDFYGNLIAEYHAQKDGIVFYFTTDLSINIGNGLVAYG